jgi:hypothetical protein
MSTRTSLVVPVWRALFDALAELGPPVSFGPPAEGAQVEQLIVVSSLIGNAADQEQWTFGPGTRRSGFRAGVQILTSGHPDAWAAAERLAEMQAAVETRIRTAATPPTNRHHRPDIAGVNSWEVVSTSEQVWSDPDLGWSARSAVVIAVSTTL